MDDYQILKNEILDLQKLSRDLDIDNFMNIGKKYDALFLGYNFTSTELFSYLKAKKALVGNNRFLENLIAVCLELNIKYETLKPLLETPDNQTNEVMIHLR